MSALNYPSRYDSDIIHQEDWHPARPLTAVSNRGSLLIAPLSISKRGRSHEHSKPVGLGEAEGGLGGVTMRSC